MPFLMRRCWNALLENNGPNRRDAFSSHSYVFRQIPIQHFQARRPPDATGDSNICQRESNPDSLGKSLTPSILLPQESHVTRVWPIPDDYVMPRMALSRAYRPTSAEADDPAKLLPLNRRRLKQTQCRGIWLGPHLQTKCRRVPNHSQSRNPNLNVTWSGLASKI